MIIIHFCPHEGGPMYEWHWAHYLGELESYGHKIIDCNPNKILKKIGNPSENAEVLKDLVIGLLNNLRKPDDILFFGAQARDDNLDPSVIMFLKEKGIPCVNFCVDGFFERIHIRKIAKYFDLNWVTHYNALSISKFDSKVIYMPMAANPDFFAPKSNNKARALGFVGSRYGVRSAYITALKKAGLKIKVRGKGWLPDDNSFAYRIPRKIEYFDKFNLFLKLISFKEGRKIILSAIKKRIFKCRYAKNDLNGVDISGPLSLAEMVTFYDSCMMSLGIGELHNTYVMKRPLFQYRLRDFECPMIGCAHLVRRSKELEECFEDGREIIYYDSFKDCIDKAVHYFQRGNEELIKIGLAGRVRSLAEHTWSRRFAKLCQHLGIKWK